MGGSRVNSSMLVWFEVLYFRICFRTDQNRQIGWTAKSQRKRRMMGIWWVGLGLDCLFTYITRLPIVWCTHTHTHTHSEVKLRMRPLSSYNFRGQQSVRSTRLCGCGCQLVVLLLPPPSMSTTGGGVKEDWNRGPCARYSLLLQGR